MKKPGLLLALAMAMVVISPVATAQTLDELARIVREAAKSDARINQDREAEFLRERDRQQSLLTGARQELAGENNRSDSLRSDYDQNERALAELETTLAERFFTASSAVTVRV